MKALVLGGSGFIGSHVAEHLSNAGMEVTVFDQVESPYLLSGQQMIVGSIRDAEVVRAAVKGMDYVLNFAGIAGLNAAKEQPIKATEVNVLGNLNLLEAMREQPPKRFMFASSYYVYSESGSIYRVTKQSCELYIDEYQRLYGIPFTILRIGSVYGPRAGHPNAIYRFLREAVEHGSITRKGRPDDQREYINVLDLAVATREMLTEKKFENQHVILAGTVKTKVEELFTMINEMMGQRLSITYAPAESNEHGHYAITPYTFKPKVAFRYQPTCFHDLGQGLLQMMHEIHEEVNGQRPGDPDQEG